MEGFGAQGLWYRLFQLKGVGNKQLWTFGASALSRRLTGQFDSDKALYTSYGWGHHLSALEGLYHSPLLARTEAALHAQGIVIHHPHHMFNPIISEQTRAPALAAMLPAVWFSYGLHAPVHEPRIAIVGGRDAPSFALRNAENLAQQLAEKGAHIVSGYARGIDHAAHRGALNADGHTWMVLPYGLRRIFNQENELQLHRDIKKQLLYMETWRKQTVWISQFGIHKGWANAQAIQRNMTVCALSKAVIVVWAKDTESGTYQTASMAQRLQKPLYVVTPPNGEALSRGCARLLAQGYARMLDLEGLVRLPWSHT